MYKIGFLGSDNSHVERFSEIINLTNHAKYWRGSNARVTSIWGEDQKVTKDMAEYGNIEKIESTPEEVVSNSDIVFVITRRPEKHLEYAKYVIAENKPLFVDKPITQTVSEAKELIQLVKQSNVCMTSFSTLRFSSDTVSHINQLNTIGDITYANYIGPFSREKGLLFYGIHIIELMLHIHGVSVESVYAIEHPQNGHKRNVQAICRYNNGSLVSLTFIGDGTYKFQMTALGSNGIINTEIITQGLMKRHGTTSYDFYQVGIEKIMSILTGKEKNPISFTQMLRGIQIASAIQRSLSEKIEVNPINL